MVHETIGILWFGAVAVEAGDPLLSVLRSGPLGDLQRCHPTVAIHAPLGIGGNDWRSRPRRLSMFARIDDRHRDQRAQKKKSETSDDSPFRLERHESPSHTVKNTKTITAAAPNAIDSSLRGHLRRMAASIKGQAKSRATAAETPAIPA